MSNMAEIVIGIPEDTDFKLPEELGNPDRIIHNADGSVINYYENLKWNTMLYEWQSKLLTYMAEFRVKYPLAFIGVLTYRHVMWDELEGDPSEYGVECFESVELPSINTYGIVDREAEKYLVSGDRDFINQGRGMKKALEMLKHLGITF